MFLQFHVLVVKGYVFKNNLNVFQINYQNLFIYFQIQLEHSSTSYMCTSCLHNISENKPSLYQVPNKISTNKIIPLVQNLTQLK